LSVIPDFRDDLIQCPFLADSVEKLDVAAEVSVHRGWNFEALLFLRLQLGQDAQFSC
jgi:hypothetical protein